MIIVDIIQSCRCMVILYVQVVLCQPNVVRVHRRTWLNMRIGIYSGTFDPVHKGHVAFALQAAEKARLDKVFFVPERKPRRKANCTHIAHRIAMIKLAVRTHALLDVLELPEAYFEPRKTYARLQAIFPDDTIVLLLGEDLLEHMPLWPHVDQLLARVELVVGFRMQHNQDSIQRLMSALPVLPKKNYLIQTNYDSVSSMKIRQTLSQHKKTTDILASVARYAEKEWLYHDLSRPMK